MPRVDDVEYAHPLEALSGKVALDTGGSRSIGAVIAKRLAADRASVAFLSLR